MTGLYELKRLQGIIEVDISTFVELKQDLFEAFREEIKNETNRIKDNFSQAPFKLLTEHELKLYIRYHQQAIIRLEGHLLHYADPGRISRTSNELDKSQFCRLLYYSLEELLTFVGVQFPQYFDADMWIPDRARLILVHRVNENFEMLHNKLKALEIEGELISLALFPLTEFIDIASSNNVNYRKLIYVRELYEAIVENLPDNHKSPTMALQWILYQVNYNSYPYFTYITRRIQDDLNATEDLKSKMDKLTFLQKLVHQNMLKPNLAFKPAWPSTREALSEWLSMEICYLEARMTLQTNLHEPQPETTNIVGSKAKVDLSVAQFAYLLRVFVDVGVIQVQNISLFLRQITKVFNTKKTDSVAFVSAQAKFYKPESSTKKAIRDLLLRMISYIDKSDRLV